ncbi:hypothetical protein [Streptomyces sp. NBC_01601]|uniref:hypothetical protein n=1 Tax=Streptomyces sp. NBC_01601 TaxID=2975892 RepID=UPI002E2D173D|nr:hypothetical protein [Streptomyces sp. NBC_01601]
MPRPTLAQAQAYAAEPSSTKLLLEHFGCVEHPDGHGWLLCPDGVRRHAVFRAGDGTPSAEEHYLRWTVKEHALTTTVAIDAPHAVLDVRHQVTAPLVGLQRYIALHGTPRSRVEAHHRLTFNGVPARRITTTGRLLREVRAAHRKAIREAVADADQVTEWRAAFVAVPAPGAATYDPPAIRPLPASRTPPDHKEFRPSGFAPGTWFSWVDGQGGTVFVCQVQALAPRGHVWIAGHADGGSGPHFWKGRLTHPAGYKGARDGRGATQLEVLATDAVWTETGVLAAVSSQDLAAPSARFGAAS